MEKLYIPKDESTAKLQKIRELVQIIGPFATHKSDCCYRIKCTDKCNCGYEAAVRAYIKIMNLTEV